MEAFLIKYYWCPINFFEGIKIRTGSILGISPFVYLALFCDKRNNHV